MKILLTGSAGHLGEALARTLRRADHDVVGLDIMPSPFTSVTGSIVDADVVRDAMAGVDAVLHTAALHKPHVVTHTRQAFVDTNVTGTLNLLEAAVAAGVETFVYTSTTSVFGRALAAQDSVVCRWVTEDIEPIPKNIYGVTKKSAEDLCELFHIRLGLACLVLRTSRFFPDEDDDASVRSAYADDNVKLNEYLYRRVDLEDVVSAHMQALERAASIGFGRYIVSATTPFAHEDSKQLSVDVPGVVARLYPDYAAEYQRRGWRMFPRIDRVYVNDKAREALGWRPRYTFEHVLERVRAKQGVFSPLATTVGFKGYHDGRFAGDMYPTE